MPDDRGRIQQKLMTFFPQLAADYAADYAAIIEFLGQEANKGQVGNWCHYIEHYINPKCVQGVGYLAEIEKGLGFKHPVKIMKLVEPESGMETFAGVAKLFYAHFILDDGAHPFDDYGAGDKHGPFTHRVQWCVVALASGKSPLGPSTARPLNLTRGIVDLYQHLAHPSCYESSHSSLTRKAVWDYVVDAQADGTQEHFGFRHTWKQGRIPERVRKLLWDAQKSGN